MARRTGGAARPLSLALASAVVAAAAVYAPAATAAPWATVDRLYGAHRYATATAIALDTFPDTVPVVYVATGENFPDALAATPVAVRNRGPIVLVSPRGLSPEVTAALRRLAPERIIVLGGEPSVPPAVFAQLREYAPVVVRVFGDTRYTTAVEISKSAFSSPVPRVYLATGEKFPDALAGGAVAGKEGVPILLVTRDSIPDEVQGELRRLQPREIVILGSPESVSPRVEAQLLAGRSRTGTDTVTRIGGADRYGTAGALAQERYVTADRAYVATGANYPDALAGGVAAALQNAPMFLVPSNCIPEYAARRLTWLGASRVTILGDTHAVGPGVDGLATCSTPAWLERLNVLRGIYGAGPLVEDPLLSGDDAAHVHYMRMSGDFNHAEQPSSPYFTANGDRGGKTSNLYMGRIGVPAVNGWATGPFHALGMFEPTRTVAGYAEGGNYAALGFSGRRTAGVTWPLTFPSNRGRVDLYSYDGSEWPDPLGSCIGFRPPTGLPILVSLGPTFGPVTSVNASLRSGSTSLPICIVTELTYSSSDSSAQSVGRAILASNHTVFLVPKAPLARATTYEVTVVAGETRTVFSFTTA